MVSIMILKLQKHINEGDVMKKIEFNCVTFDLVEKTFTVYNGSEGKYSYLDVKECKIKNEDSKFKGKTKPFTHCVLSGPGQNYGIFERKFYVGLKVSMKNGQDIAIYISDRKTMMNTDIYNEDMEEANRIHEIFTKAIKKYAD